MGLFAKAKKSEKESSEKRVYEQIKCSIMFKRRF